MSISFIHTADIHIGKKFNINFNVSEGKKRRRELWETFDKIIELCIRNNIEILLIGGDLIDGKYCTIDDMKRLASKFYDAKDTEIIITTGNKDPYSKYSLYKYTDWSKNVHIIETTDVVSKIYFKEKKLCVYSVGMDEKELSKARNCLYDIEIDNNYINILLAHGDIYGKDNEDLEIDIEKIEDKFDYIALGHIHQYCEYNDRVIYPGTPEPLDFSEKGQHGIIYGKIDKNNLEKVFVPTAKSKLITKEIYLQPEFSYKRILDIIKFLGDYISVSKDYFHVILSGQVNMSIDIDLLKREASNYFQFIEFEDNFIYDIDYDLLIDENSGNLIGDFVEYIKEEGNDDIEYQKSLLLGLSVLVKEKVLD